MSTSVKVSGQTVAVDVGIGVAVEVACPGVEVGVEVEMKVVVGLEVREVGLAEMAVLVEVANIGLGVPVAVAGKEV